LTNGTPASPLDGLAELERHAKARIIPPGAGAGGVTPLPVTLAGRPSPDSDRALAAVFARLLERKHPRTRWTGDRVEARGAPEPSTAQALGAGASREGDQLGPLRAA
jgi:hypothetical protein